MDDFVHGCLAIVCVIWAVSAIAHGSGFRGWRNVLDVSVARHWVWSGRGSHPSRRLYLDLRNPDEAPAADTRTYLSGMPFGVPVESDGQIRVPLWGSKKQALDDVGRYYSAA